MRLLYLVIFLLSSSAHAAGLFRGDLGYALSGVDGGGTSTTTHRILIDLVTGYVHPETGITATIHYALEKVNTVSDASDPVEGNRTSYGLGFGWTSRQPFGFYTTATYYPYSQ